MGAGEDSSSETPHSPLRVAWGRLSLLAAGSANCFAVTACIAGLPGYYLKKNILRVKELDKHLRLSSHDLVLRRQCAGVGFDKRLDLGNSLNQPFPLSTVQRDWEATQTVD